ncbi:MAG: NifB/NifX family molybdenum-iron cluster-binding protein [Spongiibacteraceae bacterium]
MSERKLIGVAVRTDGKIAGHAGRAHFWKIYDVWPGRDPMEVYTLELADDACLHEWHVQEFPERHPLHGLDVVIAASAGDGVIRRLKERGVECVTTAVEFPLPAVQGYLKNALSSGLPHNEHECGGEGRQHAHAH